MLVKVPCRTANIRDLDETKIFPSSEVRHARDAQKRPQPRIDISGVEFDRGMRTLFGSSEGIRTIIFPRTLKIVRQAAFCEIESLLKAVLNEGLETLGTDEFKPDGDLYSGVFQNSGLRDVKLPSTLKKIEYSVFTGCENLKAVYFPEGLEYLGTFCFLQSGLESVDFPASLRTISQGSFSLCESLKTARFAEGLEVLGTDEYPVDNSTWLGVFERSVLKNILLPSTLRRIEYSAFVQCKSLKTVKLPDGLEYIGEDCFETSGLESIKIPPAVKTIKILTFCECRNLKHVEFSEGLEKIGAAAFFKNGIECINFPSSTKKIDAAAFAECKQLRSV